MLNRRLLLATVGATGSFPVSEEEMTFHGVRTGYYDGTTVPYGYNVGDSTWFPAKFNYNGPNKGFYDTDGYHPILTDTNLTGTVAKTASSTTITGTGTAFLSELAVGYPVRVPGGSPNYYGDIVVVASITDNTHFETYPQNAPALTASGQTAYKDSSGIVIPAGLAGYYAVTHYYAFRSDDSGIRESNLVINGAEGGYNAGGSNTHFYEAVFAPATDSGEMNMSFPAGPIYLVEGDVVQMVLWQNAGGTLQTAADLVGLPFTMWRAGVP